MLCPGMSAGDLAFFCPLLLRTCLPDPGQGLNLSLLDEFPGKRLQLPSGSDGSQQQVQALPDLYVAQDAQQPLRGLGMVCIHRLGTRQDTSLETQLPRYSLAAVSFSACLHSMGDHDPQFTLQLTPSWNSVP